MPPFSALPCKNTLTTHYLNSFRRKPAISQFDWLFTPNHRSSEIFATITSSFLHFLLRTLQTAHG